MSLSTSTNDRRQASERRGSGERRRNSDDRHVVIEVCDTKLRAVITVRGSSDEPPLLITRLHPWRDEASSPASAVDPTELAAAFKTLAAEERLSGSEAVVLLGARLCVTRTATGGASEADRQVKELEERGQLYLALGGGDVCIAKSVAAIDARHRHAMVSMASQRVVDAVAEAAHQAGLNLRRVESSMVSLCRAHRMLHPDEQAPALLVSAHEEGLSIGVTHNGRLLLEYLPGGSQTSDQAHQMLDQHLGRFQRVAQRAIVGDKHELTTAYVTGSPVACKAAVAALQKTPSLNVRTLVASPDRHWRLRDGEPGEEFAAGLGASMVKRYPDQLDDAPNLLENWIRESRKHLRPILLRSAAPLAAVLLIAAVMLGMNLSVSMRNQSLVDRVAEAEPVRTRYDQLRAELSASEAKLSSLRRLADGLPSNPVDEVVQRIGHCLPGDVWVDRLAVTNQVETTISGSGFTESGVFEFVGHIESMPGANNASLQETGVRQAPQGPVTSFNMTVEFDLSGGQSPKLEADDERSH
ncbi:hypothetical protein Pla123a_46980 [Posidoniimonas polymericola]|uniref:Fimbrial assembly protein (PilN) n=1 Tax=Posidoniimonas polymericola TaxID=2528002 RepID=A0A5C5XTU3_9BACT|nr:hypothetical protein [Posidoniimonas polymericola]TWT66304.1 hypothetical protein Pla123a_46980 [Posidoniimonas polymericola]